MAFADVARSSRDACRSKIERKWPTSEQKSATNSPRRRWLPDLVNREIPCSPIEEIDVLNRRVRLLLLAVLDVAGLAALLLQLTPAGLPLSPHALGQRLTPELTQEAWFVPLAVVAGVFPLLCGCVLPFFH